MNNKPVAWMDEETGCFVYSQYDYEDLDEHGKDGLIPLYTHPVKEQELLDEIAHLKHINRNWQISENILLLELEKLQDHPVKELTDEEIAEIGENTLPNEAIGFVPMWQWIEFAKAILKKAQEK